ncbi:MAG: T9SS type A sorting domain-containing protein, partial [Bacteroidales bacterium]|nr:T9SS type A sorting domain-containing protein [Bacteroidales bacterium]
WYDELISATPTDSTWHRHWSQEDAICPYLTTPDSIQIITKDLTIGINKNSKFPEIKLKIYPNPGSDIITVEYHATMPEKVLLELSSATGAVLLAEIREADSGINLYMLDISRFPGGIYLLRLTSGLDVLPKVMIK